MSIRMTWTCPGPGCGNIMVTGDRHGNATYCSRDCALRASRLIRRRALVILKRQFPEAYEKILSQLWAEQR